MDEQCEGKIIQARTVSLAEKLEARQKSIESHLADVERARVILNDNPQLEELLTIIYRSGRPLY